MGDHRPSGTHAGEPEPEHGRGRLARYVLIFLGLLGFVLIPGTGTAAASTPVGLRSGAAQPPPAQTTAARGRSTAARVDCTAARPAAASEATATPAAGTEHATVAAPVVAASDGPPGTRTAATRFAATAAGAPVLPVGERGPPDFTG